VASGFSRIAVLFHSPSAVVYSVGIASIPMTHRRGALVAIGLLVCAAAARCGRSGSETPGAIGPTPGAPLSAAPVLVGAGDIGDCRTPGPAMTATLLDALAGTVFTLGDNAYPSGTAKDYADCYDPQWGRHKARTRPVAGNHEYEVPAAGPYFAYFGASAAPPGGYYSYDLGAWHVVALNSNIAMDGGSAQASWLREDLTGSASHCTLAYWHHPLFSSGQNGDTAAARALWTILYEAGAEIVMSGHDHDYERFAPQDPFGRSDPARGIREFVVGTGGAPPYAFARVRENSEMRLSGQFGVLRLTLVGDGYQWEFMTAPGLATSDSGAGRCH